MRQNGDIVRNDLQFVAIQCLDHGKHLTDSCALVFCLRGGKAVPMNDLRSVCICAGWFCRTGKKTEVVGVSDLGRGHVDRICDRKQIFIRKFTGRRLYSVDIVFVLIPESWARRRRLMFRAFASSSILSYTSLNTSFTP